MRNELDKDFIVKTDIDLTDMDNWEPIGDNTTPFVGVLNGNDLTISNLFIDRSTEDFIGLFGGIGSGAEVKNVNLADVDMTGLQHVGALVGQSDGGNINACSSSGNINSNNWTGGLLGNARNSIISFSKSNCNIVGSYMTGGLIGNCSSSSLSLSHMLKVQSMAIQYTGGLIGSLSESSVENSFSTGAVSGGSDTGGLIGIAV